ncbi:MAG: FKBP-type peptidyl-prolyl cis-trans isomerase [Gammaproteobacteria bacterium]|nr:FKBP-type peptidyl-prolyl cis-trans isomerase [Gammaproteobacteria bacterium]
MNLTINKLIPTAFLTIFLSATGVNPVSAEEVKLNDNTKRISYSLGYQIGGDFKRQEVEMDAEAMIKGIEDALNGTKPQIPRKAMSEILIELKRKVVRADRKKLQENNPRQNRRETELKYLAEGKAFFKENVHKPGVKTTSSGLQYKIIKAGTGKAPGPQDKVTVHYSGTLINGNVFDSSYNDNKPATFRLDSVIPGWTEGLQLISEGGRIELYIPYVLAYRNNGPLAHRSLIFDVELIAVENNT